MSFREITAEQLDAFLLRKDSLDVKVNCGKKLTDELLKYNKISKRKRLLTTIALMDSENV